MEIQNPDNTSLTVNEPISKTGCESVDSGTELEINNDDFSNDTKNTAIKNNKVQEVQDIQDVQKQPLLSLPNDALEINESDNFKLAFLVTILLIVALLMKKLKIIKSLMNL
jgi:hypothetical protein